MQKDNFLGEKMKKGIKIALIIFIVLFILVFAFFKAVERGYDNIVKDGCRPCYYDANNINFGCCDSHHNIFQKVVIVFTYYIK